MYSLYTFTYGTWLKSNYHYNFFHFHTVRTISIRHFVIFSLSLSLPFFVYFFLPMSRVSYIILCCLSLYLVTTGLLSCKHNTQFLTHFLCFIARLFLSNPSKHGLFLQSQSVKKCSFERFTHFVVSSSFYIKTAAVSTFAYKRYK